jgi:hypothetical protein
MPFIIDGTLGGKTYTKQQISVNALIEIFELDKIVNKRKTITFEQVMGVTKDQYGKIEKSATFEVRTLFQGDYEGCQISLQYYVSVQPDGKTRRDNYRPHIITFARPFLPFEISKDKEKIVFFMLHPRNSQSPLYIKGQRIDFKTMDKALDSKQLLERERAIHSLKETILNGDIAMLRNRLKGMGTGGVDTMDEDIVRTTVRELLRSAERAGNAAIDNFMSIMNAPGTQLNGEIQDAISHNIIIAKPNPNNPRRIDWHWSLNAPAAYQKSGVIYSCNTDNGVDNKAELVGYLQDHIDSFGMKLRTALTTYLASKNTDTNSATAKTKEIEAVVDTDPKNPAEELFLMGQQLGVITFSRKLGFQGIYFQNEDGSLGDVILAIAPKKLNYYLNLFSEFITTKKGIEIEKEIKKRIEQQVAAQAAQE